MNFLCIKHFCVLYEYIKFVNFGLIYRPVTIYRGVTLGITDVLTVPFVLVLTAAFFSRTCCLYALQQRASIRDLNLAVFLECESQIS